MFSFLQIGSLINVGHYRILCCRFIFCRTALALCAPASHRHEFLPECLPHLPEPVDPNSNVSQSAIMQLADTFGIVNQFVFSKEILPSKPGHNVSATERLPETEEEDNGSWWNISIISTKKFRNCINWKKHLNTLLPTLPTNRLQVTPSLILSSSSSLSNKDLLRLGNLDMKYSLSCYFIFFSFSKLMVCDMIIVIVI